ncbi:DUF4236 domain-containing protein [Deinococcus sp. 6GRE01]|uniref:DUF4236 domain-containing protein n=1 Tax=Deinococcus sp. 6GRE01 TaxID=2745873 RepID=UPI001E523DB5|nr:DUF4236 domain-containing protein [Deinococcus sp. 6GRE01]MCD0156990.1 DUF4236 domain-containing protein [Deinococcus sp. 6GRE01]
MGKIRFRKTISIGGVRVTATPKGVGASVGVRGARIGRGVDGKTRATVSIPGSGLSYQHTVGSGQSRRPQGQPSPQPQPNPTPRRGLAWWAWALIVLFGLSLLNGLMALLGG